MKRYGENRKFSCTLKNKFKLPWKGQQLYLVIQDV